ncbi:hypothetical protein BC835DRAFT_80240 [Cytidiella melzeri]|nr:hypothetical protein BC835DRAFT_80240 [Cytidiella melzeri]
MPLTSMTQPVTRKRRADDGEELDTATKRLKAASSLPVTQVQSTAPRVPPATDPAQGLSGEAQPDVDGVKGDRSEGMERAPENEVASEKRKGKRRASGSGPARVKPAVQYRKLDPPRPYPTVPTSVSATGPRSAHIEGKNHICVTRKTPLAMYLRRCKDVILNDGHKTLHLNAMGAAIPHMLQLALSLPEILPYPPEEIQMEVLTGTVELQDEVIPDDEDEDISIRTRGKSTLSVVIMIGDGVDEGPRSGKGKKKAAKKRAEDGGHATRPAAPAAKPANIGGQKQKGKPSEAAKVVIREEDMDEE